VRQNIETGARYLIDLLFRRMEDEVTESITMAPELIIRESSGALLRK
jgi:DNA-binding LacI/PurR family transcriptional regulator